jgi:hypothetical protein
MTISVSNWCGRSGKEHRLTVLEKRVLGRILAPKKSKVAEGWRRLHTEKLHNKYTSASVIRTV